MPLKMAFAVITKNQLINNLTIKLMNKILRYSLSLVLALVASAGFAQEVTLDFTDNTTWQFPTYVKNAPNTEAKEFTNVYTITVAAPNNYYFMADKTNGNRLFYGKTGATITLPKFNFDVERIDIIGSDQASAKTTRNIFVGDDAVSTETTGAKGTKQYEIAADKQAANTVYTIKVTNANNDQISKILIWKKGTTTPEETTKVDNIAAFKAIGAGNKAILTLKDAQVQYVNGTNDMYIVDATGGIDIYKGELTYTAGQILNGTIEGSYAEYNKLPELTSITASDITATDGTVTPVEMTIEEAVKTENVCKLVKIKNITLVEAIEGSYTNYYTDEDKTMQIYDKFKVDYTPNTESAMDYTGILIPYNSKIELCPTVAPTSTSSNISAITADEANADAPVYNLAGQRVGKNAKGVLIKNGKKYVVK